jgi:CheY-like chemotaxis protein
LARDRPPAAAARGDEEELKVLLVEDSREVRHMLQRALGDGGHRVVAVGTVAEALSELGDDIWAMVTDIELDGGSAIELMRVVRKRRPGVPVICMSGDPRHLKQASHDGADAVLPKPFEVDELTTLLGVLAATAEAQRPDRR